MTKTTRLLCSVLMWSNSTVRLQVKQIWREREQKKVLVLHRAFKKKKKRINSTSILFFVVVDYLLTIGGRNYHVFLF